MHTAQQDCLSVLVALKSANASRMYFHLSGYIVCTHDLRWLSLAMCTGVLSICDLEFVLFFRCWKLLLENFLGYHG